MVDTKFSVSVHLMTSLAFNLDRLMSSDELAKGMKTNPSFVRKLIVNLSGAGFVESVRGKNGGVRLAIHPKKITLDKIYDAVAEHKVICVPDKTPYKPCPVSCAMGDMLNRISDKIEHSTRMELSKMSLEDLLSEI
jgi:Rrf2 family protein